MTLDVSRYLDADIPPPLLSSPSSQKKKKAAAEEPTAIVPAAAAAPAANETSVATSKDADQLAKAKEEFKGTDDEQKAATKLQAMQRGKNDRAEVEKKKKVVASKDETAAAAAAETFTGTDDEQAAAAKMQALQRGNQERKAVEAAKAEGDGTTGCLAGALVAPEAEAVDYAQAIQVCRRVSPCTLHPYRRTRSSYALIFSSSNPRVNPSLTLFVRSPLPVPFNLLCFSRNSCPPRSRSPTKKPRR